MTSIFKINGTPIAQVAAECADQLEEAASSCNAGTPTYALMHSILGLAADFRYLQRTPGKDITKDSVRHAREARETMELLLMVAHGCFLPDNKVLETWAETLEDENRAAEEQA